MLKRTANEEASRTIASIQGSLARLRYLASMQREPGHYQHWGVAQDHGEQATSAAFKRSHLAMLENALQTDFSELLTEIERAGEERGASKSGWLERVIGTPCLDAPGSAKHSYLHLRYLLESLRILVRKRP